ncbi:MAG: HAD family hydrolase [Candidatus Niyogibacteria bacterium]|nr:HAD family hydrolase [Candidatus Niyogibacteria bacterium]
MILKPQPKAVIFDFDGTLLDSREMHNEARKMLAKFFSVFGFDLNDGHLPSSRDFSTWLQNAGLNQSYINLYFKLWNLIELWQRPGIFQGTNELIDFLKTRDIMVGLLTNRSASSVNNAILRSGLNWEKLDFIAVNKYEEDSDFINGRKKFFNQYFCDFAKPDPRAADSIRHLLKDLPEYPKSVMYIGDNLLDYYFSRDNNFSFVGVLSGDTADIETWEKAGVEMIIKNIVY